MGLFSSKTKIYVSSVVYNMAGDDYEKFLPSTLVSGAIQNVPNMGTFMMNNLFSGSGIRLRRFYTWALRSGYTNHIGLGTSTFYPDILIRKEDLYPILVSLVNLQNNQTLDILEASINWYDISYIADMWVYNNRPDMINDPYSVEEFITITGSHREKRKGEDGYYWVTVLDKRSDIKITFSSGSSVIITSTQYPKDKRYLILSYKVNTYQKDPTTGINNIIATKQYYEYYAEGTGKSYYDSFFKKANPIKKTYFPYIPLRQDKQFYSDSFHPDTYNWIRKAYKKVTGSQNNSNFNKLLKNLKDNKKINDIQYAYIQFGSSINSKNMENKKYIYEYFYNLYLNENLSNNSTSSFNSSLIPIIKSIRNKTIEIKSDYGIASYNTRINYKISDFKIKNGKIFPGARKNKYSIERARESYETEEWVEDGGDSGTGHWATVTKYENIVYMRKQISDNRYEEIRFTKLTYDNIIYSGKAVSYDAYNELGEEDESGFIIPLEYNSFKEIGLINSTDFATHCNYIVFNAYKKKKVRWYQKGIFKIFVSIVAIALSWNGLGELIAGMYYSAMFTAGMITTTAGAAAATTIAYSLAAITVALGGMMFNKFVMPMIFKAFTAIFGEIAGKILATVAVLVASYMIGKGDIDLNGCWGELCSCANILKLGIAALNSYSDYINSSTQKWMNAGTKLMNEYLSTMQDISDRTKELMGKNSLIGMSYVNALYKDFMEFSGESPDSFLNRTSTIISTDMSLDLIHNYPTYTLALPLTGVNR